MIDASVSRGTFEGNIRGEHSRGTFEGTRMSVSSEFKLIATTSSSYLCSWSQLDAMTLKSTLMQRLRVNNEQVTVHYYVPIKR